MDSSDQEEKQLVPDPDPDEGESVVPRSSHNTGSVQFQDRSALGRLPGDYPNSLGVRPSPHSDPNGYTEAQLDTYSLSLLQPTGVTAALTHDGISVSWQRPSHDRACASYERVGNTPAQRPEDHAS